MPHLNFPHQINDLVKFRKMLHVAKDVIDSGRVLDDDEFGYDMFRRGLIPSQRFAGLSMDEQIRGYRALPRSGQSPLTIARDARRTFRLFGFIEELNGDFKITKRGEMLARIPFDSPLTEEEKAVWLVGLNNLKFYNATDPDNTNRDFRIRPFVLMLNLLTRRPLENKLLAFAMTIVDESPEEISGMRRLVRSIGRGELRFEDEVIDAGLTLPGARNSVKILPTIGIQVGLIRRVGRRLRITPIGEEFYRMEMEKTPVWYRDFDASGIIKQCATAVLLSIKNGDIPVNVISRLVEEFDLNLDDVVNALSRNGIQVETRDNKLHLVTAISFDFYQDIPPDIRGGRVFTRFRPLIEEGMIDEEVDTIGPRRVTRRVRRRPVVRRRRRPTKRRIRDREDLRIGARGGREEREEDEARRARTRELSRERTDEHQEIVMYFFDLYHERGIPAYQGDFDLLVEQEDIALLHEMKTLSGENERDQIREGVGQLFYYEYFDIPEVLENPSARIVKALVFQRALSDPSHLDFIRSLGIHVFWIGETGEIGGDEESMGFLINLIEP